jgi:hypothetical protein
MFEKLRRINVLLVGAIAVIGFGIFITINLLVFRKLPETEYGIISYEFAWTIDKVQLIFTDWNDNLAIGPQTAGIWWDFPYILGYSLFIFGGIWLVARMNSERIEKIGLALSLTPFLAGILDIIENTFLLIMLKNPGAIQEYYPRVATIAASGKFTLLIVGILYFLVALVTGIIYKIRKR